MEAGEIAAFIREVRPVVYGGRSISEKEMKRLVDKMNEISIIYKEDIYGREHRKTGGLDSLFREDTSVEGPDCYGHSGAGADSGPGTDGCPWQTAMCCVGGVPGVAKTLLARLVARLIKADFSRIQFTPDLMPSDVLGTTVFNMKTNDFDFIKTGVCRPRAWWTR